MAAIATTPEIREPASAPGFIPESVYWRDYYGQSDTVYEWSDGCLEEKPVSDYETCQIYNWFMKLLALFLETRPVAAAASLDMGFRLALPDKVAVRRPDLGVVLHSNTVPLAAKDMSYRGVFDLCVEALSDSDKIQKERDTVVKKAEYAAAGVKEYFILHDSDERAFYTLHDGVYVPLPPGDAGMIQSRVLPGFQFRVEDLLLRPASEEMMEDPVYRDFVLPMWGRERAQLQRETARRREAEQRAQAAEAEITRLRALLQEGREK